MRASVPPAAATKASSTLRRRSLASAPPIANKVPDISVTGGSSRRAGETCGQRSGRCLIARSAQRSQLTAAPSASPAFARTRRNSRARRSASKEEMLAPSSSKATSQAASSRAARSTVTRWCVL